jgi:hypothetical protein
MKSGATREVEQGLMRSCTILNFYISLGRAAVGKNFDTDMGGYFRAKF